MRFAPALPDELAHELRLRSALGGVLAEDDDPNAPAEEWRVVSRRQPDPQEWHDLAFAWDVVRHVKSNGIVIVKDGTTRGICAGQTNRVSAVQIAVAARGRSRARFGLRERRILSLRRRLGGRGRWRLLGDHRAGRLDSRRRSHRRRRPPRRGARLFNVPIFLALRLVMPRFLHTSIFVNDMKESIDFYTEKLGLRLLDGPHHYPGNADMAFVGSDWSAYIELVYDLEEHPPYELGNRYEHLALEVDGDLREYVDEHQGARRKDSQRRLQIAERHARDRVRRRSQRHSGRAAGAPPKANSRVVHHDR